MQNEIKVCRELGFPQDIIEEARRFHAIVNRGNGHALHRQMSPSQVASQCIKVAARRSAHLPTGPIREYYAHIASQPQVRQDDTEYITGMILAEVGPYPSLHNARLHIVAQLALDANQVELPEKLPPPSGGTCSESSLAAMVLPYVATTKRQIQEGIARLWIPRRNVAHMVPLKVVKSPNPESARPGMTKDEPEDYRGVLPFMSPPHTAEPKETLSPRKPRKEKRGRTTVDYDKGETDMSRPCGAPDLVPQRPQESFHEFLFKYHRESYPQMVNHTPHSLCDAWNRNFLKNCVRSSTLPFSYYFFFSSPLYCGHWKRSLEARTK